jgi:predicted nucleic acid-binding protein
MIFVIDTNVLFSALIKDSTTRKLILEYDGFFMFPSYIFEELEIHKHELLDKSGLEESEYGLLIEQLSCKMRVVPQKELIHKGELALNMVKDIDIRDAAFVACALANPGSAIWSDDKALKRLKGIKVFNTQEILQMI